MPTDTLTADALAIKDAGGPWPFGEKYARILRSPEMSMGQLNADSFLYACIAWLPKPLEITTGHDGRAIIIDSDSDCTYFGDTLPEAIIAAVKAELEIA